MRPFPLRFNGWVVTQRFEPLERCFILSCLSALHPAEYPDHQQQHGCSGKGRDDLIDDAGGTDRYM
jgi:hypothetical protein